MKPINALLVSTVVFCSLLSSAQQTVVVNTNVAVPPLVRFTGVLTDGSGGPLSGVVGVTFYLYREQTGGSPLWLETQNVQADSSGRYTVMLGSTGSQGLPSDVFSTGQARWLGVQVEGLEEQPRVMLLSVPYAMKAGDAQTINGLPASAFVLAAPGSPGPGNPSGSGSGDAGTTAGVVGSGTTDFIPLWTANSILGNSALFQSGSGSTATVGINTTTPAATLDVNGSVIARGPLQLPSTGTATAGGGFNSQPFSLQGSSFNSGTSKAIGPIFQWQTEPSGNNTSNPSGTLNLLYGNGSGSPAETGLNIASNGQITFANGQVFPGAGTVTGVTAGTDLSGGGTTGNVTLNLNLAATDARYAQLGAANTFTGNQAFTANSNTGEVLNVTQSGGGNGINVSALNGFTGINAVANDTGVSGTANFSGGGAIGVLGSATNGYGVAGQDLAVSGVSTGVFGTSSSSLGIGVLGTTPFKGSETNVPVGVYGTSAIGFGVVGSTSGSLAAAVEGNANGFGSFGGIFSGGPGGGGFPGEPGVTGAGGTDDIFGNGGDGGDFTAGGSTVASGFAGNGGVFRGGFESGANGIAGWGVFATAGFGLGYDAVDSLPVAGVFAFGPESTAEVANGPGVYGTDFASSFNAANYFGQDIGVWGDTSAGFAGVLATSDGTYALIASNNSTNLPAIRARNRSTGTNSTAPGLQVAVDALNGEVSVGGAGCGANYWGLQLGQSGMSNCNNYTMLGDGANTFINAGNGAQTGSIWFRVNNKNAPSAMTVNNDGSVSTGGNLSVGGNLSKKGGSFKIDHPLDPANKYLYHSFVESPDMMNIYNGITALDQNGEAVVTLPEWFQALNRDFRYQLTAIGAPGPTLYIAEEVANNQFKIAGGKPQSKVSWQVTGIRQDVWANAHRIPVELEKDPEDRGRYLSPELYGAPETARIGYGTPVPPEYPKGDNLVKRSEPRPNAAAAARRRLMHPRPQLRQPVLPKVAAVKTPAKPPATQQ